MIDNDEHRVLSDTDTTETRSDTWGAQVNQR